MPELLKVVFFVTGCCLVGAISGIGWNAAKKIEVIPATTSSIEVSASLSPILVIETDEGMWAGKVSFDPNESNTMRCRAMTVALAKQGKLSTMYADAICNQWLPSPKYFEQNASPQK